MLWLEREGGHALTYPFTLRVTVGPMRWDTTGLRFNIAAVGWSDASLCDGCVRLGVTEYKEGSLSGLAFESSSVPSCVTHNSEGLSYGFAHLTAYPLILRLSFQFLSTTGGKAREKLISRQYPILLTCWI